MKKKVLWVTFLIALIAAVVALFSKWVFKVDDGPIEELCEEIIEKQGLGKIDLTPSSPE